MGTYILYVLSIVYLITILSFYLILDFSWFKFGSLFVLSLLLFTNIVDFYKMKYMMIDGKVLIKRACYSKEVEIAKIFEIKKITPHS